MDFWGDCHRDEALLMASYQGVHDIYMVYYYWDIKIAADQFCFIMFHLKSVTIHTLSVTFAN